MTVIPRATYRLQLHDAFDFEAARAVLPYLAGLGVSHVYCSPIWQARPGSTHGYDVVDHGRISDALGGEAGFRRLAAEARELGLGIVLDIVPNHMGVFGATNPWWLDVLENGPASAFAQYFDIDWQPPNRSLRGKLLVPVLGDHYGSVLEAGGLELGFDAALGRLEIRYAEHVHPLDPSTYPTVLDAARDRLPDGLIEDFAALPSRDDDADAARTTRRAAVPALRRRLAEAGAPAAEAVAAAIAAFNDPAARDRLSDLHDAQPFRLSFWRVASGEINYRRFFDINALAALRIEDERVFEATQGLALDLAAEGVVDGLRVDHSDGLHDPAGYFARLQSAWAKRRADRGLRVDGPLWVVAEKILGEDETLPREWALHGTTGYEFAALLNGVFVERRNADRLERIWRNDTGSSEPYRDIVRACKQRVATRALGSELTVLSNALQRVALADRRTRDYNLDDLRTAIAETVAGLPVYRTYVGETPSGDGERFVASAIADARRRTELDDPSIFDFLHAALRGTAGAPHDDGSSPNVVDPMRLRFAMRFQQFASPVAAKGVEDTAFYRYHRLVSLNDVGGSPAVFGTPAATFHAANVARQREWPHTMLASSTHDNKRAEDVRYRIDVLSERPAALRLGLRRWRALTKRWVATVDDRPVPSAEDRFLLYQTLLGSLPARPFAPGELDAYRARIAAYMTKAAREAKRATSWSRPDAAYEDALTGFVAKVLDDASPSGRAVLAELAERSAEAAWFGALNSVSATVLKLTVPGVPDTYQGTETIDLSLVDPDNRRPVDYEVRRAQLASFEQATADDADPTALPRELARDPTDGRLKFWCLWRLLQLRRDDPALFAEGGYAPLRLRGVRRDGALAFARRGERSTLVVVAGRKFVQTRLAAGTPPGPEVWGDTWIARPPFLRAGAEARDLLSGRTLTLAGDRLTLAEWLAPLTVAAVLVPHA